MFSFYRRIHNSREGNGNDGESLGNRSRRPRQYSSTLAVICATATATHISNVVFGEGFVLLRPLFQFKNFAWQTALHSISMKD